MTLMHALQVQCVPSLAAQRHVMHRMTPAWSRSYLIAELRNVHAKVELMICNAEIGNVVTGLRAHEVAHK
jgi:hypothetical protein